MDANGKAVTFNASKTIFYTAFGFNDYGSLTFTGDGLKSLNTVTFGVPTNSSATVTLTGGTFAMQGTIASYVNMNVLDTVGAVTFGGGTNPTVLNFYNGKTFTIGAGTAISMSTSYLKVGSGNLVLNRSIVSTTNQEIQLGAGASITMNADTSLGSRVLLSSTTATFGVGADIAIDNFYFNVASSLLTLAFADGATLEIQSIDNFSNGNVYISGSINQQFKIYEVDEANLEAYKAHFTSSTGDVYFEKISDGVYWVNTVVPEPAEWAAIFGAFALGLALWRRKRS